MFFKQRTGCKYDDSYERVSPVTLASVDEALSLWNPDISPLANDYLRPDIAEKLSIVAGFVDNCRDAAVLGALTGQREVVVALLRAAASEESGNGDLLAVGMMRGTFHWCAQVVNLPGWEQVWEDWCEADDLTVGLASEALSFPVTNRYMSGWHSDPDAVWEEDPLISLKDMLWDMATMASYRFWPAYNDLGLTQQDFEDELVSDAELVRFRLGLDPRLPTFEPDERVELPEGFTGLLPYRRVPRSSLARRRAAGKLGSPEETAAKLCPGPFGSAAFMEWHEHYNRQAARE